jgi:hypothetical protein
MSRAVTGDAIVVKPTDNVYTVLVIAATAAQVLGLVALFVRAANLFGKGISSLF